MVLKGEQAYTNRPNAHLEPIDFDKAYIDFKKEFGDYVHFNDLVSYLLYPKVFTDFQEHFETYGAVRDIPTPAFFFGLKPNEEIFIEIAKGKKILVRFINKTIPDEHGMSTVYFMLNGQTRSIVVKDHSVKTETVVNIKASAANEVGAPLQGSLSKILVKKGDKVAVNTPLFIIEAMKMESTITSPIAGVVKKVYLSEKTMVGQDDLVVEIE